MSAGAPVTYEAVVRHRRAEPPDELRMRLRYALLDLAEVDAGAFPTSTVTGRFRREDYFDGTDRPLGPAVLDLVEERTGRRPSGPVRMLTQLRTMGWLFNPLSVYYCTTADGDALDALVLEVTNTPWHERHWYVLDADDVSGRGEPFAKAFHVSPFMPMDLAYRCRAPLPSERLGLHLQLARVGDDGVERRIFDADLTGRRVDPGATSVVGRALQATQTVRVSARIDAHAVRLWRRDAPFHRHPDSLRRGHAGFPTTSSLGHAAARSVVHRLLRAIEGGEIVLVDADRRRARASSRADRYGRDHLRAVVTVHDMRFYSAVLWGGSSGLGEAYRRGWFDVDDLTALLRLLARAMRRLEPVRQGFHRLALPVAEPIRRRRRPDADRDRDNIRAHYDLGNDFFELFLDETLTYSAGIFDRPDATMAEASVVKMDRLCRVLDLRPGQRIVEIGTGWGAFAVHAATHYGVEVVTTTLSAEQHRVAVRRVAEAGLAERVDVRLDHYRDVEGTFDALVAVEMIEAVDWRELGDFVEHCARLVGPGGAVAYQAIVVDPARWSRARVTEDFIKSHIFPGGNLPSVPSILDAATRRTDLSLVDLTDFGLHYAETLRRWRTELHRREDEARALGLDDAFLRLWDLYLCYCEAGFEERQVSVVQMVLERPGRTRTLARHA